MPTLLANDDVSLHFETHGSRNSPPLILLHGWTGSGEVFQRNVSSLSENHYVIVPDLRGHGRSDKPKAGYHVSRLAMDLANLISHFDLQGGSVKVIGTSLGAAIIWSFSELFTTRWFSHVVFVDQAPLQNYLDDWGPEFGNRGCNSPEVLQQVQKTLVEEPKVAHLGTINACLGYRSHPMPGSPTEESESWRTDETFFLNEALKGDGWWFGKLMADHTAKDWRVSIAENFGPKSGSKTKVLVVASSRSGCFPAPGPLKVVDLVNGGEQEGCAKGVIVDWGGHWCYWEDPEQFNDLVTDFLNILGACNCDVGGTLDMPDVPTMRPITVFNEGSRRIRSTWARAAASNSISCESFPRGRNTGAPERGGGGGSGKPGRFEGMVDAVGGESDGEPYLQGVPDSTDQAPCSNNNHCGLHFTALGASTRAVSSTMVECRDWWRTWRTRRAVADLVVVDVFGAVRNNHPAYEGNCGH
ncbi:non-heme chloroperoxidase [Pyrenophora seminiperda CCB06]|uniref:Non-heme chloroperoxidase n=1 Tax=Pyrenophora seminiperda CCB06 TaxID=1302712 RepID=A0A3M7M2Q8_9PLEO|nr:non-heme chloroperoxidase [Pyrenophora seminiperda CCB06]